MKMSKIKGYLTVLLFIIIAFAAAGVGIWLGQLFGAPVDDDASRSALEALDDRPSAPKSKYNVLLMGTDASGDLTDVMMVYQIDPKNNKVNVLSIPRDTRIYYNKRVEKINAAHSYGRRMKDPDGGNRADEYAIRAVKELTGIPIHHYICINFAAFRQIIDAIGGFDFNVPRNMNYDDDWQDLHIHLTKGFQHLDGDKAEQLVRFRHYPDGDIDRVRVQQQVLRALVEQKVNISNVDKVPEIFNIILDNIDTDMTGSEAAGMAQNVLAAVGNEERLSTEMVPGDFGEINNISYWFPDIQATRKLVEEVFGYVDGLPVADDPDNVETGGASADAVTNK